jgi:hypothetical protein
VTLQIQPFGPTIGARVSDVRPARGIDDAMADDEPARRVMHRATIQREAPCCHA